MDPDVYPAAGSFVAMFGKYTVDEAAQTFTLRPIGAHDPALIGADVLRHVTFENDLAVFRTPTHMSDGVEATTTITWRPGCVHPQA